MNELQIKLPTDTWVIATWDEYIEAISDPHLEKAKSYYDDGQLRIEMPPVGFDHASDNTIIIFAVNLFCTLKGIPLKGLTNCSYRKIGVRECQPDVSYYIGERAKLALTGTSVVDLNSYSYQVANRCSRVVGNKVFSRTTSYIGRYGSSHSSLSPFKARESEAKIEAGCQILG